MADSKHELKELRKAMSDRERAALNRFRRSPEKCFYMNDLAPGMIEKGVVKKIGDTEDGLHSICVLTPLGQRMLDEIDL